MIWLIGNKGMLGQELSHILDENKIGYFGTDREADIRDIEVLREYVTGKKVEWIVNCSAYTAVDKAEDEEELARSINATGAGNIAQIANEISATLIHISTDYVFKGDGTRPYLESDPVDPQGAYGRTKAEGESLIAEKCLKHFIIRTAWLYGQYGPNFVSTMLKLMKERNSISVVADQKGTPTWAFDLATAIFFIINLKKDHYGIYHYTNAGETTWFEFAKEIQNLGRSLGILSHDCSVNPITSDQYPSKVKRPMWSVLSKEKIKNFLGVIPPEWKESLKIYLKGIT